MSGRHRRINRQIALDKTQRANSTGAGAEAKHRMNDVIVIGCGPVGLFSALLLGQRGLNVTAYERWGEGYPLPRACGIDHEIMRQLQRANVVGEMGPFLDPVIGPDKTYEFVDKAGETLLKIDWNRPGKSGWPQMNMFYQPDLEKMLVQKIERLPNVRLRYGFELVELCQSSTHVEVRLVATDDRNIVETDHARYVIGADGARSTVRTIAGISQTDLGFAYDWLVVDVAPLEDRVWKPYVVQRCDPARPATSVASGPGRRRWEFMRLPGETNEELNNVDKVWELLAPWGITPDNARLERHTVYTFRGCWADRWKDGRLLLAGDAAHLMPPFLGQGLCSGMRDAMALAWRLAMVLRAEAPEKLLDSYGPERSAHVQEIIVQAVALGRVICILDPAEAERRDATMKAALEDPAAGPKPPPEPQLGSGGIVRPDDPNGGYLSVQGRVRHNNEDGLFDDVVGPGWQLLIRDNYPATFTDEVQEVINRLGIVVATFGAGGDTVDLDGTYVSWFDELSVDAILIRPDFYVFGTSAGGKDRGDLVIAAWKSLQGAA
jgi:2-polyprenyl-6-methoxyphenol hydroxylase-like FAD-dependent oxidoreductase